MTNTPNDTTIELDFVPMHDGAYAPWILKDIQYITLVAFHEVDGERRRVYCHFEHLEGTRYRTDRPLPSELSDILLSFLVDDPFDEIFYDGQGSYDPPESAEEMAAAEGRVTFTFDSLPSVDAGIIYLGKFEIDVGEFTPKHKCLVTMDLQHQSDEAWDGVLVEFDSILEGFDMSVFDLSGSASPQDDGFAYFYFDLKSDDERPPQQTLEESAIEAIRFRPITGGPELSFQERRGSAYHFGSATLGGALVTFAARVVLPPLFTWGEETKVNDEGVILGRDYVDGAFGLGIFFSYSRRREEYNMLDYSTGGLFKERTLLPAGELTWCSEMDQIAGWDSPIFTPEKTLTLPEGETFRIEESFTHKELTAFGIALVEGDEEASIYWWRADEALAEDKGKLPAPEELGSLEEVEEHFAIKAIECEPFEIRDGGKYHFALTPKENVDFYFASALHAPVRVSVGPTPTIHILTLDKRWA